MSNIKQINNIKKYVKNTLCTIADECHKKDDDFSTQIEKLENLYKEVKNTIANMEKDIFLYRYKSINEYAKSEVGQEKIYLNRPSKFDDIFDSSSVVDISPKDMKPDFASHIAAQYFSKIFDENKQFNTNGWDDFHSNMNKIMDKHIRIACFSENNKNVPLWYYYADQHKGICLEYSLKEIASKLSDNEYIMPVVYTDNFFRYNPTVFFDKSTCL